MICKELICAESIIIDDRTKRVSAVNIIDDTLFNSFPALLPFMVYLSLQKESASDDQGEVNLEVKLDSTIVHKNSIITNFQGLPQSRSIIMTAVPVNGPCTLKISVVHGTNTLKEKSFILSAVIKQPVATQVSVTAQ